MKEDLTKSFIHRNPAPLTDRPEPRTKTLLNACKDLLKDEDVWDINLCHHCTKCKQPQTDLCEAGCYEKEQKLIELLHVVKGIVDKGEL